MFFSQLSELNNFLLELKLVGIGFQSLATETIWNNIDAKDIYL